jgi:hypothetical protein
VLHALPQHHLMEYLSSAKSNKPTSSMVSIDIISTSSNRTIDIRLVHLRLPHILQRVHLAPVWILIERWTKYWPTLPVLVNSTGQRPHDESFGHITQLQQEQKPENTIQAANSRRRSRSSALSPLGCRRSVPVRCNRRLGQGYRDCLRVRSRTQRPPPL